MKNAKKRKEVDNEPKDNKQFIKQRPRLPESENEPPPPLPTTTRKHLQRGPRVDYTEMDVDDDDHFLCEYLYQIIGRKVENKTGSHGLKQTFFAPTRRNSYMLFDEILADECFTGLGFRLTKFLHQQ